MPHEGAESAFKIGTSLSSGQAALMPSPVIGTRGLYHTLFRMTSC